MIVVGLSALYHESACCVLVDGRLVAAAAEERFSRIKHDAALPVRAFRWCLERAGARITDLDAVAWYEEPETKLSRQLWAGPRPGDRELGWLDPGGAERAVRERLGWDGTLLTFPHHLCHAASTFLFSGFEEAAVLTADGVGEWATTAYGHGSAGAIDLFAEVDFPHSLGLFYSAITAYLGLRVDADEYKVMGLAPYGRPRLAGAVRRILRSRPGPSFELDRRYFAFLGGERMDADALGELLGRPRRRRDEPLDPDADPFWADVAASAQAVLEEVLLEKIRWLHAELGRRLGRAPRDLAMAGGVALNCVANGRILRQGPFDRLFVQPAAGDAGGSLGAAALAHRELGGGRPEPMTHCFLGPAWEPGGIARWLASSGLPATDFRGREEALVEAVAERLACGAVVGWLHGAMEHGPRALGGRSLLADPRAPGMRDRLNRAVKGREEFRPFAPSVLADRSADHFDLDHPSPYMLETCRVVSPLALPAVTHVDGSARPQTVDPATSPRFAALLAAFERRTGCPVLLNTSFNVAGEAIVASPADALLVFATAPIDVLVLEDFVVERADLPAELPALVRAWRGDGFRRPVAPGEGPLSDALYAFV